MNTKLRLTSLPERIGLIEAVVAVDSVNVLCEGEKKKKGDASGEKRNGERHSNESAPPQARNRARRVSKL